MPPRTRLAPGVPAWDALGLPAPEELLAGTAPSPHAEAVDAPSGAERWRVPLPGTTLPSGRLHGAPRGAGTGWIRVTRWTTPPLADRLRARFTAPASASLAEREWNLLCALRAAGVPTAEPLAVASEAHPLCARRSVLVARELEEMLPLDAWLDRFPGADDRAELERAVCLLEERIARSGARLPKLSRADLVAHARSGGRSDCAVDRLRDLQGRRGTADLALSALPEVAVADVTGGRIGRPRASEP